MQDHVKLNRSKFDFIREETLRLAKKLDGLRQNLADLSKADRTQGSLVTHCAELEGRFQELVDMTEEQAS
jgi:hypothetical protein